MSDAGEDRAAAGQRERVELESAITALEGQRAILGDAVVDTSLASLRARLEALPAEQTAVDATTGTGASAAASTFAASDPSPAPVDAHRSVDGGRRRRQVTVLFADMVGFTALSEHLDVEDISDWMNALWSRLDREVLDHGDGRRGQHRQPDRVGRRPGRGPDRA